MDLRVACVIPGIRNTGPVRGVFTLTKHLQMSGVNVDIVAMGPGDDSGGALEFKALGAAVTVLDGEKWNIPTAVRKLRAALAERRCEVCHSTGLRPDVLAALLRRGGLATPMLATVRSLFREELRFTYGKLASDVVAGAWVRALNHLDCVVPHSLAIRDALESYGVTPERMKLIYNGVDVEHFSVPTPEEKSRAKRDLGLATDAVVLGYVGRFTRLKDLPLLFRAIPAVCQSENVQLLMVGGGEQGPDLRRDAARMGIESRIIWTGFSRDVRRQLMAMDVFILPSLTEGLARALLEAGAVGVPAIATSIPSNREVVLDGVNGYLFPPGNSAALGGGD